MWERLRLPLMKLACRREVSSWHTTLDTTGGPCLRGRGGAEKKVGERGKGENK